MDFSYTDRISTKVLNGSHVQREHFDPENRDHLSSLKKFLSTGNWGKVQFFAELPYVTVPETVMRKFCEHSLKAKLKSRK